MLQALALIFVVFTCRPWSTIHVPEPARWEGSGGAETRSKLRDLKRDLRDRHPETRRRAVSKLALLDTREAWDLIVAALSDPDPQVGDEAQLKITAWADPRGILFSKEGLAARDELVRLRVAESFGRRAERVDGEGLARRIDARDVRVAQMLIWSLERLARQGLLFEFSEPIARRVRMCLRKNLDPGLRANALAALAVLDPAGAREELEELLVDRDAQVRCAALAIAEELDVDGLLALSSGALADEAGSVRSQAVACLERLSDRAAIVALAGALETEIRPRLRADVVAGLQRLSGRKYRDDVEAWTTFAAKLPTDWSPAREGAVDLGPGQTMAFAGLPIVSDRVCFLVDFSGSLWHPRADGRTPKEILDRELRSALEALPEGTEFNVIPYTREPHPWREDLAENRPRVVADALRYFERCRETGPGSFFEAARLALAIEGVDAIVVLSDGAPTGGEHWNLDLLFELLVYENRYRKVTFDSVLVDAPSRTQRRWSEFAVRTGGHSIAVEMDADEAVLRPQSGSRSGGG